MRLERIELTDFLSVKGTVAIDVDKRVTILLGSNDHGKSNILRALQHMNDDTAITEDETNWDASDIPVLTFQFELSQAERQTWSSVVDKLTESVSPGSAEPPAQLADAPLPEIIPSVAQPRGDPLVDAVTPAASTTTKLPVSLPALDPSAGSLILERRGVGAPLQLRGVALGDLPEELAEFIQRSKPRAELFKLGGNLQDSATASSINTVEYEFLQGVFFYAGLDPRQSSPLFEQDDRSMRMLDNASQQLDANLRGLWGQGTELHFALRHKGSAIEFLADDPAIKARKARMSKRSDGVTQFFRVSMVLHARRNKNPAHSYIYLFDEPGAYLHPQGQRDIIQVFEQLAEESQIVYATHSLFMLNQNYPERHRLVYKDDVGTKIDQKPYRQNWKLATDALGVYLSSNILFSGRVLLVEGDSDPLYLYELFRQLNRLGEIDVDVNPLGIMSFSDYHNLRFLLQVFKREGQDTAVLVLVDGDSEGRTTLQKVEQLCKRLNVPMNRLGDGRSIEDYCLLEDKFLAAVQRTLRVASESEGKAAPGDLEERVTKAWEELKATRDKKERKTGGRWFKELARDVVEEDASKVSLARYYVEACRELKEFTASRDRLLDGKTLCVEIGSKLRLPPIRATRTIETR